jgi:hypothetical protein
MKASIGKRPLKIENAKNEAHAISVMADHPAMKNCRVLLEHIADMWMRIAVDLERRKDGAEK